MKRWNYLHSLSEGSHILQSAEPGVHDHDSFLTFSPNYVYGRPGFERMKSRSQFLGLWHQFDDHHLFRHQKYMTWYSWSSCREFSCSIKEQDYHGLHTYGYHQISHWNGHRLPSLCLWWSHVCRWAHVQPKHVTQRHATQWIQLCLPPNKDLSRHMLVMKWCRASVLVLMTWLFQALMDSIVSSSPAENRLAPRGGDCTTLFPCFFLGLQGTMYLFIIIPPYPGHSLIDCGP